MKDLSVLLLELALEKETDQHLNAYRPAGGNFGNHGRGHQGPPPGEGITPKNARYTSNLQDLLWCDAEDERGGPVSAVDCDQHECLVVQGKKQETNTGGKAKIPDNQEEDKRYLKQRLSAKLKSEAKSGSASAGGKSHGERGKGKSQGRGKGQGQAQGKGRGRGGPNKKKQDKNKDKN